LPGVYDIGFCDDPSFGEIDSNQVSYPIGCAADTNLWTRLAGRVSRLPAEDPPSSAT
jgi:hypothetical protein